MTKTRARRTPKIRRHKGPVPFTSVEFPDGVFVATRDRKRKAKDDETPGSIEFLARSGLNPKAFVASVASLLGDAEASAQFARWLTRAVVILRGKERRPLHRTLRALLTAAEKGETLAAAQAALNAAKIVAGK